MECYVLCHRRGRKSSELVIGYFSSAKMLVAAAANADDLPGFREHRGKWRVFVAVLGELGLASDQPLDEWLTAARGAQRLPRRVWEVAAMHEGDGHDRILSVCATKRDAEAIAARVRRPRNTVLEISPVRINRRSWLDGFVTVT